MRQLLDNGVISLNFVSSEVSLVDPLTIPLRRKLIYKTTRGVRLMPVTKINNDGNPIYEIGKPKK